jgi:predicted acyltransferase
MEKQFNRDMGIDALRGLAIVGMVLSGTIAQSVDIPAWMYHAQVGPPDFKFHPEIPGITWVDLVFPFFLFAMGLSFPFSMNRFLDNGGTLKKLSSKLLFRTFNLFLFAVMLPHLSPYRIPEEFGLFRWLFTLAGFVAFFLTFSKFPKWSRHEKLINLAGYLSLVILMIVRAYAFELPFSIHSNDIIILVLANMALVAAFIWILTRTNLYGRLGILAFYLAIRLGSGIEGSYVAEIYRFAPVKFLGEMIPPLKNWLLTLGIETDKTIFFSMNFIKYLFIVIPGTILGDILFRLNRETEEFRPAFKTSRYFLPCLGIVLFALIPFNLFALYTRHLLFGILGNLCLWMLTEYMFRRVFRGNHELRKWLSWSFFWLFLGLMIEPFEGGIKKDHATLSYFFVTSGLSGLLLLSFKIAFNCKIVANVLGFLPGIGKNPMVGYVAVTYLIVPLLALPGLMDLLNTWASAGPFAGILKGFILTGLMIVFTLFTVKIKHLWKT